MLKLDTQNTCECIQKLMILGFLKEFIEEEQKDCYYNEIENGQICMKRDIIVDNGNYDEDGISHERCSMIIRMTNTATIMLSHGRNVPYSMMASSPNSKCSPRLVVVLLVRHN